MYEKEFQGYDLDEALSKIMNNLFNYSKETKESP